MRKRITSVLLVTIMFFLTACGAKTNQSYQQPVSAAKKSISIATGTTGGTAYYIGAAQSQILNAAIDSANFTVEATDGSPVTNSMMVSGDVNCMGLIAVPSTQLLSNGLYPETNGLVIDHLRAIMVGHATALQFITLKDTGITSLEDLKGKRIATSNPGTTTRIATLDILSAMGYKDSDFASITAMTPGDMADALKDNAIDVGVFNGGVYIAAVSDLNATRDIVMLQVPQDVLEKVITDHPAYTTEEVTPEVYSDLTENYTILSIPMGLFCHEDMDEDLVYQITKVMNESTEMLASSHAEGKNWTTENTIPFLNGDVPFHPGAVRYYNEILGR